jgi:hypothetical protein
VAWCGVPASANAQIYIGHDVPRGGNVELGGGVVWSPGYDLGTAQAEETRNPGSGTGPFVLFQSDSRTESDQGLQGKFGVYHGSGMVEAACSVGPDLSARLTGDAESAPEITATETLNRFVVDGSCCSTSTGASFGGGRGFHFAGGADTCGPAREE